MNQNYQETFPSDLPKITPSQSSQRLSDRITAGPELFHPDPRILQNVKIEISNHGLRTVTMCQVEQRSPVPSPDTTAEEECADTESSTAAFIITELEEPSSSVFIKPEKVERTPTKASSSASTSESPLFVGFPEEGSGEEDARTIISPPEQQQQQQQRSRRIKTEEEKPPEEAPKPEPRRGLRLRPLSQIMKSSDIYDIPQGVFRSSSRLLRSQEPQQDEEMMPPPPKKGRGGAQKPKPALKEKTEKSKSRAIPGIQGDVTCGRCEATISATAWDSHLFTHNGVAWRVGIDRALDLENDSVRGTIVQAFMKKNKLSSVKCEKCGISRKSGVGLVSHEKSCGLPEGADILVTCEHCSRRILPCSLRIHQTNHCRVLKRLQVEEARAQELEFPPEGEETSTTNAAGRQKRKSTRMAETKFRLSLEPNDNEPFPKSESDASFGIESSDSDGTSGVTETSGGGLLSSDPEDIFRRKKKNSSRKKQKSSSSKKKTNNDASKTNKLSLWRSMNKESLKIYYSSNIKEFYINNYSIDPLFPQWVSQQVPVIENDYLPKSTTSIFYDQYNVQHYKVSFGGAFSKSISTLQCFESKKGNPLVIYCGGPVLCFDWLQNPPEQINGEILAVSCGKSFQNHYTYTHTVPEKTAIQIWNVGTGEKDDRSATFLYGIAYEWAPVLSIKFCPSGGFSDSRRLGLLAVSSCVGKIEILALPIPPVDGRIIKLTPSVILESRQEGLLTKIAWSPARGHAFVAGGFANGKISIWKLDIRSRILRLRRDRTEILYPIHFLHAYTNPVSVLIFPHTDNYNVLLTASLDKNIKLFNLDAGGIEISNFTTKSQVTSAATSLNWPMYIFGTDNTFQWNRTEVSLKQPFNVPFDELTNLVHSQEITDLDINNWNNVIIAATESGDICTSYRQHYGTLSKKAEISKNILGYTDSILLLGKNNVSLNVEVLSANIDNCAVLFCDFNKGADMKGIHAFRTRNMSDYPVTRINKIAFNPNERMQKIYAVGYQAGFIRFCQLP